MERYLTTDAVIVVIILFNIYTLEVSIGVPAYQHSQLLFGEIGDAVWMRVARFA